MKNLLAIELGILVIAVVAALPKGDLMLSIEIIGSIGLIFMVTAAILMGSFSSGDRIGANYNSEEREERRQKNRLSEYLFFVGLFNIAISAFAYKLI